MRMSVKTGPILVLGAVLLVFAPEGVLRAENRSTPFTPLQLSIWNPVQLVPEEWGVCGARVNLPYGKNQALYGVDVGFVNLVMGEGIAVQAGVLANLVSSNFIGVQAGLLNVMADGGKAVQAGFMNCMVNGAGLQIGLGNVADNGAVAQIGLFNLSTKDLAGLQVGGLGCMVHGQMNGLQIASALIGGNSAGTLNGVQIGLSILPISMRDSTETTHVNNYANSLNGIQIGLWCNRAVHARGLQLGLVNIADRMSGVQIGLVNIIKESPVTFLPIINAYF